MLIQRYVASHKPSTASCSARHYQEDLEVDYFLYYGHDCGKQKQAVSKQGCSKPDIKFRSDSISIVKTRHLGGNVKRTRGRYVFILGWILPSLFRRVPRTRVQRRWQKCRNVRPHDGTDHGFPVAMAPQTPSRSPSGRYRREMPTYRLRTLQQSPRYVKNQVR